ncbi:MAG: hypothetical protein JW795_22060 [Chitinivibrionales bacterium]|nr:hypothetical protein [Chitinivibrionales bacterium]
MASIRICIACIPVFFVSCLLRHGDMIESSLIPSSKNQYTPNQGGVAVYFENVPPPFAYEQIGLVKAVGAHRDDDRKIIDRLKYEAWKYGADAVMSVKRSTQAREEGYVLEKEEDQTRYDATLYTGVAIKCIDSICPPVEPDSVIIDVVPKQLTVESKTIENQINMSIFAFLIGALGAGVMTILELNK